MQRRSRFGFYFAPLAWVAALPVASIPDLPALAFARRFLPLFVVLQTLYAMSLLLVAFPVAKTIASARREYLANAPLALPGASHVRLPPDQVSHLRGVVRMLQNHGCETYLGAPGMGSFYFWIRRDPPTRLIGTRWSYHFDLAMQEHVVRDLERVDRGGPDRDLSVVRTPPILAREDYSSSASFAFANDRSAPATVCAVCLASIDAWRASSFASA